MAVSLRTRLTISYVSFFAIALLALDVGLYLFVRQSLTNSIDSDLRRGAQLLQQDFTQSNSTPRGYFNGERLVLILRQPSVRDFEATNLYVQVYQQDGELLAESPNSLA